MEVITTETLTKLKILTGLNSLSQQEADVYWELLLGFVNQFNEEIQYAPEEINDTNLLQMLLVEDIILRKQGLWGDTLAQHKANYQRYLNTVTGLGV